jgi:hypothetical protein
MRRMLALSLLMVALLVQPVPAQSRAGTAGLQFLSVGMGPRTIAMGGSGVALVDDASSVFWNPAGLAMLERRQAFFGYVKWPAEIQLSGASLAGNLGAYGQWAVSFMALTTDEMLQRTVFFPEGDGSTFTAGDYAVGLTFARHFTDKFAFGATGRWVRESLHEDFADEGWAFDVGTAYDTGYKTIRLAVAIANFGPDLRYEVDQDGDGQLDEDPTDSKDNDNDGLTDEDPEEAGVPLPLQFQVGLGMTPLQTDAMKLNVALDLLHPNDNQEQYHLGGELWYHDMVALRLGYEAGRDEGGFSAGAGFRVPLQNYSGGVDYAYSDMGLLEEVHRASLYLNF